MTLSVSQKWLLFPVFFLSFFISFYHSIDRANAASVATPAVVIKDSKYAATLVKQSDSDPVEIVVGKSKTVVFTFKNTGTTTWDSTSKRFISAYTMEPRNHASIFVSKDWINKHQTGRLSGKIKPGKTGELAITFKAPNKPGEYTEKFYLASENHSWVKGGYFFVKIKVVAASALGSNIVDTKITPPPIQTTTTLVSPFPAQRIFLNPKTVSVSGGEPVAILFGYQNTGERDWVSYTLESTSPINVADTSWQNKTMVQTKSITTQPQGFLRDTFSFRVPAKVGSYTATFVVKFNGAPQSSAIISIPVSVTADAPLDYQEPFLSSLVSTTSPNNIGNEIPRLSVEPNIRVGVWKDPANNEARFISDEDDYDIYDGQIKVSVLPKGIPARLIFDGSVYTLTSDLASVSSTQYLHLQPSTNPRAIFTLTNFDRHITGKGRNFNRYRGAFELRQAQDKNTSLYGINELLFEDYMVGMGENSNNSPLEYLKSQAVAQRTYAYYTKENTGKHDSRNFDVVAHTGDQLYLGAENEPSMGRFIEAVNATRGLMVTYNNDVVATPYYGNSDGRTRSWTEVWGGKEKPWLVSVPATYDARDGKKMYGHGVGMSQRDAAYRADEEKIDFVALLKYYYTGIEVHKIYP